MEQSIFEKKGGKYIKVGDYYVPDFGQFDDNAEPADERPIGKYGKLRKEYLEKHKRVLYNDLMLKGKLHSHLCDTQEQAQEMLDVMIQQYKACQGVTEELKATNQLEWVGRMNNIVAQIEEIILAEMVYV